LHWAIGLGSTEEMIAEGFRGLKAGYKALKVKAGGNPVEDVLHIREIRQAVGPDVPMTVDFNMAYDVKTAIRVIH
jgi:L-alanine-DL-glutamate epimerase-like enolase superfamily enzyme